MKKFIALTIGLSLLGAALIVPMSDASREAYHSYMAQKVKESGRYRHSTYRQGNQKQFTYPRRTFVQKSTNGRNYRNSLLSRTSKRNIYRTKDANKNLKLRTSTSRIMRVNHAKNSHRMAISANSLDANNFMFATHSNEIFSLEIPTKSIISDENNVLEVDVPTSGITISAKKLESKCGKNLALCARAISRTLDSNGDIYRSSQTVMQYQKTDIVLGTVGLDSKKFVEGFIGTKHGKSSFIARFVVEGLAGDLFLVEVVSDLKDIDKNVVYAKKAFETFRAIY